MKYSNYLNEDNYKDDRNNCGHVITHPEAHILFYARYKTVRSQ